MPDRLLILKEPCGGSLPSAARSVTFAELKAELRDGRILRRIGSAEEAVLLTSRLEGLGKPLLTALLTRALARRRALWRDATGAVRTVDARAILALAGGFTRDLLDLHAALREAERTVADLENGEPAAPPRLDLSRRPAYLRTDLSWGVRSGGSVGHIAGVANNLGKFGGAPIIFSCDEVPTLDAAVTTRIVAPDGRFRDFREVPIMRSNAAFIREAHDAFQAAPPSFIYQRYSLHAWAGVALAREWGVPLVLEYNGSEIWMARHWGAPLKYEPLAARVELLDLRAADLVVVVSRAMRDELAARGIAGEKIIVNPNGVDTERYSPAVDGSPVRKKHGLEGKLTVGFIGTFGAWHGAEVLAEAWGLLLARRPEFRTAARLLMVGDGARMPLVRAALERHGVVAETVLTGLVPQADGPAYLAAADILVASHVPNPDGTPFFGSPTKLFEYLAMGRAIVASDLDQIGELLEEGRTALLVPPGDAAALADGLARLLDDAGLRARLGIAARAAAVERHTWRMHTARIVDALRERCR